MVSEVEKVEACLAEDPKVAFLAVEVRKVPVVLVDHPPAAVVMPILVMEAATINRKIFQSK